MSKKVRSKVNLPGELIEEILSRVPPTSLARFRAVSKQWNRLFNDKKFINNHKATFRFILATESKIYSVSIDPKIEVRELTLDVPGLAFAKPRKLVDCNEFILCDMKKGAAVLNPWLRQARCIEPDVHQSSLDFDGIGYDNTKRKEERGYKTYASYHNKSDDTLRSWKVHDSASDAWEAPEEERSGASYSSIVTLLDTRGVSLNGTLYWVAKDDTISPAFCLLTYFSFSTGKTLKFCTLPCGNNHRRDALVLRIFREDRFSLLNQCHLTKKIKIWVTKNKISNDNGKNVEWMNFMEVSSPNLPDLVLVEPGAYSQPSYFIDDKRLVVCSCDETGRVWIYVLGGNKLISKIPIDSVVDPWPLHCTYFPSLVPVPRLQREEVELQV